jgi:hypothetical protein
MGVSPAFALWSPGLNFATDLKQAMASVCWLRPLAHPLIIFINIDFPLRGHVATATEDIPRSSAHIVFKISATRFRGGIVLYPLVPKNPILNRRQAQGYFTGVA